MVPTMASRHYTTREVAKLLKLPEHRIRAYVRLGVVRGGRDPSHPLEPGDDRRLRFDFRDILVLKTARELLAAGLPAAKVERALSALKSQLGEDRPLSAVRVSLEGGVILVSDGDVSWEPESGQGHLSFPSAPPDPPPAPPPSAALRSLEEIVRSQTIGAGLSTSLGPSQNAEDWFNLGLHLEQDDLDGAYEAYLRALACRPEHLEAMINLGRLCSEIGDEERAAAYFRQAIRVDPTHPVAHFNLAVTLHDSGDLDGAGACYRAALIHDPDFADAHFNLAALLEEAGDHDGAQEHMAAYRHVVEEKQ
jgi:tetratricopeptide (TPR) repeat protein